MHEVLNAQTWLKSYGVSTDVWSVTSYNELRRDAQGSERWNRLHPTEPPRTPYIAQALTGEHGVFIAASDYMSLLPRGISEWVPGGLVSLGTDGYGLSESRAALRDHFEVDARHIATATLHRLFTRGDINADTMKKAYTDFKIDPEKPNPHQ